MRGCPVVITFGFLQEQQNGAVKTREEITRFQKHLMETPWPQEPECWHFCVKPGRCSGDVSNQDPVWQSIFPRWNGPSTAIGAGLVLLQGAP